MEWGKMMFIYFCMCLAVSFFFPRVVISENTTIIGIFNLGINSTTDEVYITSDQFSNSDINNQISSDTTQQGLFQRGIQTITTFFQFIVDGLGNIIGLISVFFKFLFSPFIFVFSPNLLGTAPSYVKLIFGLPLVFLALLGFIHLIGGRR